MPHVSGEQEFNEFIHAGPTGSQSTPSDQHLFTPHPDASKISLDSWFDGPLTTISDGNETLSNNQPDPSTLNTLHEDTFYSLFDGPLTPLPSHMEFSSNDEMDIVPRDQDGQISAPELTIGDSFNSLFDGPLTPLPSLMEDSFGGIKHREDPEPNTSNLSTRRSRGSIASIRLRPSLFDALNNVREFGTPQHPTHTGHNLPGRAAADLTSSPASPSLRSRSEARPSRPHPVAHAQALKRTRHCHWKMGTGGSLIPIVDEDDSDDSDDPMLSCLPLNEDEIFEREMKKLKKHREALMRENSTSGQGFNKAMRDRAMAVFLEQLEKKTRKLGPEGTELIDEDEEFEYPAEWIEKQSQSLRAYPTKPAI
jgi:hypothetical protein